MLSDGLELSQTRCMEVRIYSKRDELETAYSVDISVGITVLAFKISALRAAA